MEKEEASWRMRRRISSRNRSGRYSSYDQRVVAICLGAIAVISPLYIDRRKEIDPEIDEQPTNFSSYSPLLLMILMAAIAVSGCRDRGFFPCGGGGDPNWIHRVGGSSIGIVIVLLILAFVLKCKSF